MTGADPTEDQIASLALQRGRPLVVCDADEVLFQFFARFEPFIESRDLYFNWDSYRLAENIRRRHDHTPLPQSDIWPLVETFFAIHTETMDLVPGAHEALHRLGARAQVLILTNIPIAQKEARRRTLDRHGFAFPLVVNQGPKGPAVGSLARRVGAPVFFIDDSTRNHQSVAEHASHVRRLQFVAHPRLARLVPKPGVCHHRADVWPEALAIIEAELRDLGHP